MLSEALYSLEKTDGPRMQALGAHVCIVTLSAKITMPGACRRVIDVLGQFDAFGELNSRTRMPTDVLVDNAGHRTNTKIARHLPVTRVLRGSRERGALAAKLPSQPFGRTALRPAA